SVEFLGATNVLIVTNDEEMVLNTEASPIPVMPAWKWLLTEEPEVR
ncbi:MAG: hypothetical protein HN919_05870, partial [Verrucomicrobia bacterium]|nr:hypothetical protein [Verrucomicrobiota bacterium]